MRQVASQDREKSWDELGYLTRSYKKLLIQKTAHNEFSKTHYEQRRNFGLDLHSDSMRLNRSCFPFPATEVICVV